MKKFFIVLIAAVFAFTLAACSVDNSESGNYVPPMEAGDGNNYVPPTNSEDDTDGDQITNKQYAVGDIILADGSAVKVNNLSELDNNNLPVAVIAQFKADGSALGIGVHRSEQCLRFEAQSANEKTASDYVAEYATTYQISGEFATGWRLPEVEELKTVYANRNAINASLQKIYGFDRNAAMNGLSNVWYWTGTLASKEGFTWFVHFVNGYAGECERNLTNLNVMAVRSI